MTYPRQYVNTERTVLVTEWEDGTMTVATREQASHIWGPPVRVEREG